MKLQEIVHQQEPIILRPSLWKNAALLLVCAVFVATGIWMGRSGEWLGYLFGGFFGLGVIAFLLQFLPGTSYLQIEGDGFTVCSLFRKGRFLWKDIDEFFIVKMKQKGITVNTMVGFNFSPSYDRSRTARAVATAVAGCEGALPDTYGQKAQELVDYLNHRLAESRSRPLANSKGAF